MFEIKKSFHFEAGHSLEHHDGKCRTPHGHSYQIEVVLQADCLIKDGPEKNMVTDFGRVSAEVKPMIENFFDHKWLNETLETDSPTAEFIAQWIFDHLKNVLPNLNSVTVAETGSARAKYWEK